MMAKFENLATVEQAAKILDKHPSTIRRWINNGKLPAQKLGGKHGIFLIRKDDVLEIMIKKISR